MRAHFSQLTSAHDPLNGYLPIGWTWEQYRDRAEAYPAGELKHGPLALVDNDMPVVPVLTSFPVASWNVCWLQAVRPTRSCFRV